MLSVVIDKRENILHARVTERNKKFLEVEAKKNGVTVSRYMDALITSFREKEHAGNKSKSKKRSS